MSHLSFENIFAVMAKYKYLDRRKRGNAKTNLNFLDMCLCKKKKKRERDIENKKNKNKNKNQGCPKIFNIELLIKSFPLLFPLLLNFFAPTYRLVFSEKSWYLPSPAPPKKKHWKKESRFLVQQKGHLLCKQHLAFSGTCGFL